MTTSESEIKRYVQCQKCPWRKDCNPYSIPNGYQVDLHHELEETIAQKTPVEQLADLDKPLKVMACHEEHETYCIGWLWNQLGDGNNLRLRIQMTQLRLDHSQLKVIGEQHKNFKQTLPKTENANNQL